MPDLAKLQRWVAAMEHRPAATVHRPGAAAAGPHGAGLMQLAAELNAGSAVRRLRALAIARSRAGVGRAPGRATDGGPGEGEAPVQLARAPARSLRPALLASSALSPIQLVSSSWWGALGGAALGLGLTAMTGGVAALPMLGAAAGGALLGRQAVIESGNLARAAFGSRHPDASLLGGLTDYQTGPTEPGTLEGFLPGASRHKAVVDHVFNQLRDGTAPSMDTGLTFGARQDAVDLGPHEADTKLRNDVYVAHVMADHGMMQEAAGFALAMARLYGTGGERSDVISGRTPEMAHLWPDQDLTGERNQAYRGYGSVVGGIPRSLPMLTGAAAGLAASVATGGLAVVPALAATARGAAAGWALGQTDTERLAGALADNIPTLRRLASKATPYTAEETAYILRAMGQLRDVMKPEKNKKVKRADGTVEPGLIPAALAAPGGFPDAPDVRPTGRIKVSGGDTPGLGRSTPSWHGWSRGLNRKLVPIVAPLYHGSPPYEIQGGPDGGAQGSFDFLMGTSGTTLDMLNFFLAQGKTADEAARLMQVFYANWHKVAPDGNAHSQSESIGTMTQYLYGRNLKRPIMTPIQKEEDVREADVAADNQKYFSPLTEADPGYLVGGRRA